VRFAEGVRQPADEGIGRFKDVIGLNKEAEAKDNEETVVFAEGVRQGADEGMGKIKDAIGLIKEAEVKDNEEAVGFAEGVCQGAQEGIQEASRIVAGASCGFIKDATGSNKVDKNPEKQA